MSYLRKNYERLFLLATAISAIFAGSILAIDALAVSDRYHRPEFTPDRDVPGEYPEGATRATGLLRFDRHWQSTPITGAHNRGVSLFNSVPLLIKDGKVYDLKKPGSKPLRPPFENIYLVEHRLPFERSDVGQLDTDGDGFTNLEEFLGGKTDPRDPLDHPPFTDKLCLQGIVSDSFSLYFSSRNVDGICSIREIRHPGTALAVRPLNNVKVGNVFGTAFPGRWLLVDYVAKSEINPRTKAASNTSELTVRDLQHAERPLLRLVYHQPFEIPTYQARFRLDLPGFVEILDFSPKVGEEFELPCELGVRYKLLRLGGRLEDGASIRRMGDSPPEPIEIGACSTGL